jgi:excisionase family DNA binding protein
MSTKITERSESRATFESVDDLARYLGVSRTNAYAGLRAGTIPGIRLGKRFIVPRAAIDQWLLSAAGTVNAAA